MSRKTRLSTSLLLCLCSLICTFSFPLSDDDETSLSFTEKRSTSTCLDNNNKLNSTLLANTATCNNDSLDIINSAKPAPFYNCNVPKGAVVSMWVSCTNGHLTYSRINQQGDTIPDFSFAGYGGGGVPIPQIKASIILHPLSNGSADSTAIQAALDSIGRLPLVNGFRGSVLLSPGIFTIGKTLYIRNSGVVLKGSGTSTILSVIVRPAQLDSTTVIIVGGIGGAKSLLSSTIVDTYIPVNSYQVTVANGSLFKPGDTVFIQKPISKAWIQFMGMDHLVRNGKSQLGWGTGQVISNTDRTIVAVNGNKITLDVPLTDALNSSYGNCTLRKYTWPTRISNVGVENLHVQAPFLHGTITDPQYIFAVYNNLTNAWLRDIDSLDMSNGVAILMKGTKRVTVQNINIKHTGPLDPTNGYPPDIQSIGTQNLFENITDVGSGVFYAVTESFNNGPNVFRNMQTTGIPTPGVGIPYIAPHQRWATGVLFENIKMVNGGIQIINRGIMGTGQGWSAGYTVVWNSIATSFGIQNPPGAFNLCVGCTGQIKSMPSNGNYTNINQTVWPTSLYYEQLSNRLRSQIGPR